MTALGDPMLVFSLLALFLLGIIFSPFPCLRTYALLWRYVLLVRQPGIGARARLRQVVFLLRSGASIPLWTLLWYADELLFPAYRRDVVQPLFIIGQPRSGTTLLHRTMAADTGHFFSVRHFEWRYPFICIQRLVHRLGLDPWVANRSYWPDTEAGRLAARMHPNMLSDYEEDGIFYEERFMHHLFVFLRFPYPGLLAVLDSFESLPEAVQRNMLAVHHRVIQKVSYLRGGAPRQYLSKEVTSHSKIPRLLGQYPDARFIVILRPSSEFIDSLLALVRSSTLAKTGVDPLKIDGWRDAFLERMRQDCGRLVDVSRNVIGPEQQVRLSFHKLTTSISDAVVQLYNSLGLSPDGAFRDHLRTLDAMQSTRDRGYEYRHQALSGFSAYDAFVREEEAGQAVAETPAASHMEARG